MLPLRVTSQRSFTHVLLNTAAGLIGTAFVWFSLAFWAYLETRSVLVTSVFGGAYMLGMAVSGVPFGTLIDRHHKHRVMVASALGTALAFVAAGLVFWLVPREELVRITGVWFWLFAALVLSGALLVGIRSLALATCVTILVPSERRASANGKVGMAQGMTMLVSGVFSGLAVGRLGMGVVILIGVTVVGLSLVHLMFIRIPEPEIVHAERAPSPVDFRGAWVAVRAVPGLLGLIIFSTFNNFLGGVFGGLLDPYGLELMSVEAWGVAYGVCSLGFIVGGAIIAKVGLGAKPLRTLLWSCTAVWLVAGVFTIRETVWLLIAGMIAYMVLSPFVEAAEQTMLQRVVPLEKQGRVFGFAQAVELSAAPFSAFVVGPLAEFWIIPYARSDAGREALRPVLGDGTARGIALVFLLGCVVGLIVTFGAFASRTYRQLSEAYDAGDVNAGVAPAE